MVVLVVIHGGRFVMYSCLSCFSSVSREGEFRFLYYHHHHSIITMTIYGIGGVSGTGKTHFRTNCVHLRETRAADIADVYEESITAGHPNLHWRTALERFVAIVRGALEEDRSSDIVLEAFFRPGGVQRQAIERLAREFGVDVRWGWAWARRSECLRRVSDHSGGQDSSERIEKRLSFINSAEPEFFREIEGESLQQLAAFAEGGPVAVLVV